MEALPEEAHSFCEYFESTWVKSPECNWYAGASPYVDNNNGTQTPYLALSPRTV